MIFFFFFLLEGIIRNREDKNSNSLQVENTVTACLGQKQSISIIRKDNNLAVEVRNFSLWCWNFSTSIPDLRSTNRWSFHVKIHRISSDAGKSIFPVPAAGNLAISLQSYLKTQIFLVN